MELPHDALVNYVFPNNTRVWWSAMIVIYPYITGLIAGAFMVSTFYHVFKIKEFKPIANFSLVASLCFAFFAGVPLLVHLTQPQRAWEIYATPHFTSAMSIFGYVYTGYLLLLMLEIWIIYRPYFIRMANRTKGIMRPIWYALTLGVTTYHPESENVDRKVTGFLAGLGIPWACLLHGYVGFVFGSVKAIRWWATPLQPIIFLSSAVVSGMAMILVMYSFIMWRRREPYDFPMIRKLMISLWIAFVLDWALEMLDLVHVYYRRDIDWEEIGPLIRGPLFWTYVVGQIAITSFIPTILLGYTVLSRAWGKKLLYLANVCSFLLLAQVLLMRFNVVIGGQLISKSGRGFVDYEWDFLGKEGLFTMMAIFAAPFVVYYIISRFLPIFDGDMAERPGKASGHA
ncbi:MAG: polysulfide reductase NrfD [Proteobacteria bacterium]|nr:polysulfide reductase NrfD [Pseudomonadota bacterium]